MPKHKAKELIDKFANNCLLTQNGGKVAALITVNEILLANPHSNKNKLFTKCYRTTGYWLEVKKKIENYET